MMSRSLLVLTFGVFLSSLLYAQCSISSWSPMDAGSLRGTNYFPNSAEAQCDVFFFLQKGPIQHQAPSFLAVAANVDCVASGVLGDVYKTQASSTVAVGS